MTTLDWAQCAAVESVPGNMGGAWVLRNTLTPVKVLFENLGAGLSIDEVIEQFPVTREQIDSLLTFVLESLEQDQQWQSVMQQTGASGRRAGVPNEEDAEKLAW